MISSVKSIKNVSNNIKKISQFKILFLLFLIGFIYGALLVGLGQISLDDKIPNIYQQFVNIRLNQSIIYTFIGSITSSFILILIAFILGFCGIGQSGSLFLPLFHGLGIGFAVAHLYQNNGLNGILFTFLLIFPAQLIYILSLLLASRESLRLSNKIFKLLLPSRFIEEDAINLKLYIIRFLVISILVTLSSIIDAACTFIFARFF